MISNQECSQSVISSKAGVRRWYDAAEFGNWLRLVKVAENPAHGNLRHLLIQGQIYYETIKDVEQGDELLLTKKSVIDLDSSVTEDSMNISGEESHEHRMDVSTVNSNGEINADDDNDDDISRYQCLQCDKHFGDYDTLDEHLVSSHGYTAGQFICDYCPRAFAWRPNLIQHKTIHGEFKRYPCENCNKVFTDPAVLQKHIRTQHSGARSHVCPECGKTFGSSSGLKQHTHIHSSVKPFQCEVCFKAYTQFSNLCRHKRMHADCRLQIKCTKCSQAFSTVTSLAKHKKFCDTAPSISLPPGNSTMSDFKISAQHYGMSSIQSTHSQNSLMMYSRPPLSLLPQSLLPNYPMLPSLSSLVGAPQHSLLTSSLLLPFQNNTTSEYRNRDKMDYSRDITSEDINPPPVKHVLSPESNNNLDLLSPHKYSPPTLPSSPKVTPSPHESPKPSDESSESKYRNSDAEGSTSMIPSPKQEKSSPPPSPVRTSKGISVSTPLDLTIRREEMDTMPCTKSSYDVKDEKPSIKNEDKKPSDSRSDLPFLSISELLKESTPRTSSTPTSLSSIAETPTKYFPLAYPKPINPQSLFDACRNTDRRSRPLLPPSLQSRSYPTLPFFPPSTMGGMSSLGLGLARNPGLDMLRAHMSVSPRHYNEMSRPYDLMPSHMSRPKDRYSCKFCGKVFPRSANLTRHLRTHTGEQPYKCKFCERSFSISSNLQRHVRNIHNKEKPFKCPLCDRSFGQQTNLDRHLRHHEEGRGDVPDSSCAFDTPSNFINDEIRSFVGKVTDQSNDDIPDDEDDDLEEDDDKSFSEMTE